MRPHVLAQQLVVSPTVSQGVGRSAVGLEVGRRRVLSSVTGAIGPNQCQAPRTVAEALGEELARTLDPCPTWP